MFVHRVIHRKPLVFVAHRLHFWRFTCQYNEKLYGGRLYSVSSYAPFVRCFFKVWSVPCNEFVLRYGLHNNSWSAMESIGVGQCMPTVVATTVDLLRSHPCATSAAYLREIRSTGAIPGVTDQGGNDAALVRQSRMWSSNARSGLVDPRLAEARLRLYEIATGAYRNAVVVLPRRRVTTTWIRARTQQAAIVVSDAVREWMRLDEHAREYWRDVIVSDGLA